MKILALGVFLGLIALVALNLISEIFKESFNFLILLPFISFSSGAVISYFIGEKTKRSILCGAAAAVLGLAALFILNLTKIFHPESVNQIEILFIVFSAVFIVFGYGVGAIIGIRLKLRSTLKEIIQK